MSASWERYIRDQEANAIGKLADDNLAAILDCWGAESVERLARYVYKHTACGPHLSAFVYGVGWVHSGSLASIDAKATITKLAVGSIIEGMDECPQTIEVDLLDDSPTDAVVAKFNAAVEAVNDEVSDIIGESHGESE